MVWIDEVFKGKERRCSLSSIGAKTLLLRGLRSSGTAAANHYLVQRIRPLLLDHKLDGARRLLAAQFVDDGQTQCV